MKRLVQVLMIAASLGAGGRALAEEAAMRLSAEPDLGGRDALRLAVENATAEPQVIYLDSRLAAVELLRGGRRVGRCSAPPGSARAGAESRRFVRLAPGGRANERLDLRFLCFGRMAERLAEADGVRVTYRSTAGSDPAGRPAVTARLGPVEVTLPPRPEAAAPQGGAPPAQADAPLLRLVRVGPAPDVGEGSRLPVTLEVRAPRRARLPAVVRPDLFAFDVRGPGVEGVSCGLGPSRVRPLREFYDVLGAARIGLDLARVCPERTFARSGVYEVTPRYATTHDGHDVGLEAWTGTLTGEPFLVRVRRAAPGPGEPVEIEWTAGAEAGNEGGDAR